MSLRRSAACLLIATATAAACGGGDPVGPDAADDTPPPDAFVDHSGPLFDPSRVIDVSIDMAAADWDALRVQTRSITTLFGNCLDGEFDDPFTYFTGTVTVDGTTLASVGVRKKGFLGSLDPDRPSLKFKFDEYVDDQRLLGLKGFTLNNARQDPSLIRQCLAFETFAAAGVPASRCNFAHVRINGADLGIYVHVESGNKDFIRRHYDDPEGNLYEGTLSDFRDGWTGTFELKTNESTNDRSDLDALVTALQVPDNQLLDALDPLVDIDEFLSFWATEILVTHWDGYAGNTNNFLVYHDPRGGKFEFIPWGVDGTLNTAANPFGGESGTAVQAQSMLARRLYLLPETRDRYITRLQQILGATWNETSLLAEIDAMEGRLTPIADPTGSNGLAAAIENVRDFVRNRRQSITDQLAAGPPAWTVPLRDPPCFESIGNVSGSFTTTWGTIGAADPFSTGSGTMTGTINSVPLQTTQIGSTAGYDTNANPPNNQIAVVAWLADGTAELIVLAVDPASYATGDLPIDWTVVFGAVYHYTPSTGAFDLVGLVGDGTVHLSAAGQATGAVVTGTYTGSIIKSPF